MSHGPWGVPPPSPVTESKFFNAARKTVTLLVEAGVDQRFWRMHCDSSCHVRHHGQGGREAVLEVLGIGSEHDDSVLLAVLDADLDRVEGRLMVEPDVVWTDAHDLETTLLQLPTLEKLVAQRVGPDKLADQEAKWEGERFRARLFRHAEGVGRLRWLKHREGLDALIFKKTKKGDVVYFDNYAECVERDWSPSLAKVITALRNFSGADSLRGRDLAGESAALPAAELDQICNGHDLVGFLVAWLKPWHKFTAAELADTLAGLCERSWLVTTAMWQAIEKWEAAHPGFRVLKGA